MCSRLPRPRALTGLALWLALTLPLAVGCGHKENPKPPPQKIPETVRDLRVAQRGDELRISFTYPQTTISGLPIEDIVAIELWEYEMAVPDFPPDDDEGGEATEGEEGEGDEDEAGEAQELEGEEGEASEAVEEAAAAAESEADETPAEDEEAAEPEAEEPPAAEAEGEEDEPTEDEEGDEGEDDEDDEDSKPQPAKETLLEVDSREFVAVSSLRLTLEGDELSKAIRGDKVNLRLTLGEIEPGEKQAFVYGVKTFQSLNRASAMSNLVKIIPRVTPEPPAELEIEPVTGGVKLSWTFEGDEPVEFRFYRRDPLAPAFDQHFGTKAGDSDQFLDASAEFGKTYIYAMSVVINRTPLVESAFSPEREVEYLDVFPPEAPTDLVVLSEVGTARLLWERSSDRDVVGYVVYRRTGSGEFQRLNEQPVPRAEYSDTGAASGRVHAYRVVAVDRAGNMSDPSEEVEVRIP